MPLSRAHPERLEGAADHPIAWTPTDGGGLREQPRPGVAHEPCRYNHGSSANSWLATPCGSASGMVCNKAYLLNRFPVHSPAWTSRSTSRRSNSTTIERTTLYVALVKLDQGTAEATAEGFSTITCTYTNIRKDSSPTATQSWNKRGVGNTRRSGRIRRRWVRMRQKERPKQKRTGPWGLHFG